MRNRSATNEERGIAAGRSAGFSARPREVIGNGVPETSKLVFCYSGQVKTTLDLPDDLVRTIKLRAVREDRKLKDLIAELLRRGLEGDPGQPASPPHRVQLPLIRGGHPEVPEEEMTPDRVAAVLLDEEVRGLIR